MFLDRELLDVDALEAAEVLLGSHLRSGPLVLRISEVEAYRGPGDSAAHSAKGRTARTEPMFGPAGHAYVYLCYGIHTMLNIVAGPAGHGVLIRSCEVVEGLDIVAQRRKGRRGPDALNGPGKVGQALALSTAFSGSDLLRRGALELHAGDSVAKVLRGPRVGIDYADPEHRNAPWRLALDSRWVSHRGGLR